MADVPPLALTPEQCRWARKALGWSQETLAGEAGLAPRTIGDFERGSHPSRPGSLALMARVLESAGIEFLDGEELGVRMRTAPNVGG